MSETEVKHISITPERKNTGLRKFLRWLHIPAFRTTFRTMLRVPLTDLYHPAHRKHSFYPAISKNYRGLLGLSLEACTGCKKCERACPTNCIIMETRVVNGKEHRFPAWFAARCMFCGLCEESCDRQFAIRHTDQFEDAGYTRDQLFYPPERMFLLWDKHIQPMIKAGISHKATPDKKRSADHIDQWPINRPEEIIPRKMSKEEIEQRAKEAAEKEVKKKARAAARAKKKE